MDKEDIEKFKEDIRKLIEKNVLIKIDTENKKIAFVNIDFCNKNETIEYKLKIDILNGLYHSEKIDTQLYFDF